MNSPRNRARIALPGLLFAALAPVVLLAASCAESIVESGNCPDGFTQCDDDCINTQTDPESCGACGHECPEGAACEDGACVAECSGITVNCDGSCVHLGTDTYNCGACGLRCPPGAVCSGGVCNAPCPGEMIACGGGCVDGQSDPLNCGGCGVECPAGDACQEGECIACPEGMTDCSGLCVDTQTNTQHCGGCGLGCASGFTCEGGQCQNPCDGGLTPCNGQCVDTQSSGQHCGGCNNSCALGQECQGGSCACTGGACGVCSLIDLGSMIPQSVNGSTWNSPDLFFASCGGSGGEVAYSFTAPADGSYFFNTNGSGFDSVLAALSPSCVELACNDNFGFDWYAKIIVDLVQGETIYVVVDGWDQGSYVLNVGEAAPPMCPVADLGSTVPQVVNGSTLGAGDALTPSCSVGGPSADQSYTFTAPADGSYSFDTFGSMFDTVLHVRESCAGAELSCSNDVGGGWDAFTYVALTAGQSVVVSVEGAYPGEEGDFVLNIEEFTPPPCPMQDLGSTVPQTVTGNTMGLPSFLVPGCSPTESPEMTYSFTAPTSGMYTFDTFGSQFDTVLHVHDATCSGPELGCNDDSIMGTESEVSVSLQAGQTVMVVVDGYGFGNAGPFTLNVHQ